MQVREFSNSNIQPLIYPLVGVPVMEQGLAPALERQSPLTDEGEQARAAPRRRLHKTEWSRILNGSNEGPLGSGITAYAATEEL